MRSNIKAQIHIADCLFKRRKTTQQLGRPTAFSREQTLAAHCKKSTKKLHIADLFRVA